MVLISVLQYNEMRALGESRQWVFHTNEVIREIAETRNATSTAESAARGFALSANPAMLRVMIDALKEAGLHEHEIRSMTTDNPRQQRRLDRYERLLAEHANSLQELIDIRRERGSTAAADFSAVTNGGTTGLVLDSLGKELQNEESALLAARVQTQQRSAANTQFICTAGSLFSIVMLGAAGLLIRFDLRRQRLLSAELRSEKDLFTTLMNTVPDSVYFKDRAGRFLRVNASMARRVGIADAGSAIGKSDADFNGPEHAAKKRAYEEQVMQTRQPVIGIEEKESLPGGTEAWMLSSMLPIVDEKGTVTGTFGISRDITASKHSEQALETANSKLAAWNAQLESRNREIVLLAEMSELLQTCNSEAEAESILNQYGRALCPGLAGSLSMTKPSRNLVETTASWGDTSALVTVFAPEDCWALRRGRSHGSGQAQGRLRCAHIDPAFEGSFLCIPMMAHGETLGVLHLLRPGNNELTEAECGLAAMVGEQIGQSIANLRLRDALKAQSIRDPLTSLFNRRYMEESIERELHRANREQVPVGAIMLDLDHFKQFNDSFGHEGGDAVLRAFSELLGSQTRREDIVCRYGGEEFLILVPGASQVDTEALTQHLVESARKLVVVSRGRELGVVTTSAGIAIYPVHGSSANLLIRAADDALYRAKTAGRDRWMVAEGLR